MYQQHFHILTVDLKIVLISVNMNYFYYLHYNVAP